MNLKPSVQLWAHQETMREQMLNKPKALMLAGCGVGKTLASLALVDSTQAYRVLVITVKPAIRSVWEEEIATYTTGAEVLVLDKGTTKDKAGTLEVVYRIGNGALIVVVNYETARMLPLDDYDWDMVILDESHKVKAHNSQTSIELTRMLKHVPRRVLMTGTAWDDRPTDVFGQIRFLTPVKRGRVWASTVLGTWSEFFEQFVIYREVDNIKIPIRYKNLDALADLIASYLIYVNRDEVLSLPPVQHINRRVTLSSKHMKAYQELKKELVLTLGGDEMTVDNQMVLALRLHQMTGGYYQPDSKQYTVELPDAKAKVEALTGIVEELGNEPFVVFTRFKDDVDRVRSALVNMGITCKVLIGGRDEHLEWRRGDGQALIVNIQAGGTGINLTRAAYAIYYSVGYSNTDYQQSLARIDRPGQKRKVTIFHIIARGTIDETIREMLDKKDDRASELLDEARGRLA